MPKIRCNDVELYYEIKGKGPPLLLINGLGSDMRLWGPLTDQLESSFTVIAFDNRGMGKSERPEGPYTISQMVEDTYALIGELSKERVHVLGFSMGGCIAMQLALENPRT